MTNQLYIQYKPGQVLKFFPPPLCWSDHTNCLSGINCFPIITGSYSSSSSQPDLMISLKTPAVSPLSSPVSQ